MEDICYYYLKSLLGINSGEERQNHLIQSLLFVDDTNIFYSHRNNNHLVFIANNERAK